MENIKIFIFVLGLTLLFSCHKKKPTETPPDNIIHPQVDIPWPSLAGSPWPIAHGNMQCTGRTKYQGPQQGFIEWKFPEEGQWLRENNGSAVIGEDGTIYFTTNHYLYALNPDGSIKWKFFSESFMSGSPMIGAGDIIYIATGNHDKGCYYAINNEGKIIWEYNTPEDLYSYGDAIGLDGTIYFAGSRGTLYALNPDGSLKWQTKGFNGFNNYGHTSIAMSPNCLILYVMGLDSTLNAVDSQTGSVMWQYFQGYIFRYANHMVDCEGNVYFYVKEKKKYLIVSLTSTGELRWIFNDDVLNDLNPTCDMHIDKDGNIYFCTNTKFCSLNYDGYLRWAVTFKGQSPTGAIVGDINGFIYFGFDYLLAYDQNGNKKFECYLSQPLVIGAISNNKRLYLNAEPYFYCIK